MFSRILTFLFMLLILTSQAYAECVTTLYYKKIVDVEGGIINVCNYPRPVLDNPYVVDKISNDMCRVFDPHCRDVENLRRNFLNTNFSITCDDSQYYGVYLYVNSTQYPGSVWASNKYPEYVSEYFRLYDKKTGDRLYYSDFADIPSIDVLRQRIVNGDYKVFSVYNLYNSDWRYKPFDGRMNEVKENLSGVASMVDTFSDQVVMDGKHNVYLLYQYGKPTKNGNSYYAVRIKSTVPEITLANKTPLFDGNLSFRNASCRLYGKDSVIIEGELYNNNRFSVLVKTIHLELDFAEGNQTWGQHIGQGDFVFNNPVEVAPCSFTNVTLTYKLSWQEYDSLNRYRDLRLLTGRDRYRIFRYY